MIVIDKNPILDANGTPAGYRRLPEGSVLQPKDVFVDVNGWNDASKGWLIDAYWKSENNTWTMPVADMIAGGDNSGNNITYRPIFDFASITSEKVDYDKYDHIEQW